MAAGQQYRADKRWFGKRPGLFINNIRFYVLVFSLLVSVLLAAWLRLSIEGDRVYLLRLQQVYGFVALGYLYVAILATPVSKLLGKEGFMKQYLFARRAIGVSAAWFASLHMLCAVFGQLGGIAGLGLLPGRFWQAVLFGLIALIILLIMAAASFDSVIRVMTFPRWKWLQRMVYVAAILLFFHVWMLGTHMSYTWVRWVMLALLLILAALESWRIGLVIENKSGEHNPAMRLALSLCVFLLLAGIMAYAPSVIERYHGQHESGAPGGGHRH